MNAREIVWMSLDHIKELILNDTVSKEIKESLLKELIEKVERYNNKLNEE